MRNLLLILLVMSSFDSFCQQYEIHWTTNSEIGVLNYKVEQSIDTILWNVLTTVTPAKKPDSNKYSYPLPFINAYVRINANMIQGNYYTKPIYVIVDTSVITPSIINATYSRVFFTDILSWSTLNERNSVNYYLVEKASDSIHFSLLSTVSAKGDSKYSVTRFRLFGKPSYRVTTILKSGVTLQPVLFK